MVWPIISYGAALWGTRDFSSINAIQDRACRFYLGMGKYAPNAAVNGDTGWLPPVVKQWKCEMKHWFRLNRMDSSRLNSFVFIFGWQQLHEI